MSFTLNYTGDEINAILARANNGGEIDDELALKAPLESPALTGTPTAPTQAEGDDSTTIATTEYADRAADAAGAAAEAAAKEYTDEATSALYITDTASGSIASFSDGTNGVPMRSVKVAITPVQSGSGDPSPDNVRPISGWTGAEPVRTGKNLFDESTFEADSWIEIAHGNFVYNATAYAGRYASREYFPIKPLTSYYFAAFDNGVLQTGQYTFVVGWYDKDKQFISAKNTYVSGYAIISPAGAAYFRLGVLDNFQATVNYPSTDHDYHAYAGQTYPVTWESQAGTVYGGTIDVVSGVLTVDRASVDMGDLSWILQSSVGQFRAVLSNGKNSANDISSIYPYQNTAYWATLNDKHFMIYTENSVVRIGVYDSAYTDAASFKTAVTGQTLVYELATPVTYQLTPQQITSLYGQNNVWSNTGDTEVTYVADPKLYIAKMLGGSTLTLGSVSPLSLNRPVTISEEDLEQAGEVSEAVEAAAETVLPAESGEAEGEAQE